MERPLDIFQDPLMRRIIGGLKSAINDHGPVTKELISSAAKRIYGNLKGIQYVDSTEAAGGTTLVVNATGEDDSGSPPVRSAGTRTVSDLVKGTTAEFVCYRDGELWYRIVYADSGDGVCLACGGALVPDHNCPGSFEFPVPISDTGSGIFSASMKGITLMRWVRRYLEAQKTWQR